MMNEYICLRDGMKIYCRSYVPDTGNKKYPTIIMCHGFNGSYSGNIKYADIFTSAGYACVMFDFCGGAIRSRSDGNMVDMTVTSEVKDLDSVIDFTLSLEFCDSENLFLMGKSQGGVVAAIEAAKRKDEIRGLLLFYPAFVIPHDAREREKQFEIIPESIEVMGGVIGKPYLEDALSLDLEGCIKAYNKNVLILQGDKDEIVPLQSSEKAADLYKSATLHVINGAGHGFSKGTASYAGKIASEFIRDNIK